MAGCTVSLISQFSPPISDSRFLLLRTIRIHATGSLGTKVNDVRELPCRCWEPNLDLLNEQQVLLTAEPMLQPFFFLNLPLPILYSTEVYLL